MAGKFTKSRYDRPSEILYAGGLSSCRDSGKSPGRRERALPALAVFFALGLWLACRGLFPAPAYAQAGETADWTVMFYFCGTDLESKYSYATENLSEIMECSWPENYLPSIAANYGVTLDLDSFNAAGTVNVLIETGGCTEWHAGSLGMDIPVDRLARWVYECYPGGKFGGEKPDGFRLVQELPLQSMADPGTLSDFIRWGRETFPAEKYALVLWDHGGGSKTGLFIDELFAGDILYLYELPEAFAEGGTHFDVVLFDACMMANIETAWAIKDYADWMVASEEVVPGKGTAISRWLQELYNDPLQDGRRLCRNICDMTQIKYANEDDGQARSILTWSVIDLDKVGPLVETLEQTCQSVAKYCSLFPSLIPAYAEYILRAEEYGDGVEHMKDLGDIFYNPYIIHMMDALSRSELLSALEDAVVYALRGSGRSGAHGLSFCYAAAGFTNEELSVYAKNCPVPSYLAILDSFHPDWTAPDWVYETAEHLKEINTLSDYQLELKRCWSRQGFPGIALVGGTMNVSSVLYRLYKKDEMTDTVIRLGRTSCVMEESSEGELMRCATRFSLWPSIDGELCDIELIRENESGLLYNIPIQIGNNMEHLRCGRLRQEGMSVDNISTMEATGKYEIYGIWEGYDEDTMMPGRNVESLSSKAGRDYVLLYPQDGTDMSGRQMYLSSQTLTMYRVLDVEEITLPPGNYYLEYEVDDLFMNPSVLERIPFYWDGQKPIFPDGFTWEGTWKE